MAEREMETDLTLALAMRPSPAATGPLDVLEARLTPILEAQIQSWEPGLLARIPGGPLGSMIGRWALANVYPFLLSKVPELVKTCLDFVAETYGNMTLNDLIAILARRLEAIRMRPDAPAPPPRRWRPSF
jgi:hypothetical protein